MTQTSTDTSLVSLPNSLQTQIERAQSLLSQSSQAEHRGDRHLAIVKAREGLKILQTLATTSPTHAALLVAAEMGYKGFEVETIEQIDAYQVRDRKILGITVGSDVVNVPTITRRVQRARLF